MEKEKTFSKEIVEFSKIIDETFGNVSKDILTLTTKTEKSNKNIKSDVEKISKEITYLKITFNALKKEMVELTRKVKRNNGSVIQAKPVSNKEDIKELKSELTELKLSIKKIEQKLKMD
jgi:polyhydroxyalkanoate synthesis regulator phasin